MIRRAAARFAGRHVASFVAIGLLCTVAFAALYSVLRQSGVPPLSANAIALTATMVVNFLANRHFTFDAGGDPIGRQAFRYAIAYALGLGVSTLILGAAHALAQHPRGALDTALAVGSALGATIVRFALMRRWVFAPPAGGPVRAPLHGPDEEPAPS